MYACMYIPFSPVYIINSFHELTCLYLVSWLFYPPRILVLLLAIRAICILFLSGNVGLLNNMLFFSPSFQLVRLCNEWKQGSMLKNYCILKSNRQQDEEMGNGLSMLESCLISIQQCRAVLPLTQE